MYIRRFIKPDQEFLQLISGVLIFCLILLSNGCSISTDTVVSADTVIVKSILPVADSPQLPAVIKRLMDLADEQFNQSKVSDSIVTLERAIRIKPRYPEIWSRMAYIYAYLGKPVQARQYAERSNSYINENHPLKSFNDDLIHSANR